MKRPYILFCIIAVMLTLVSCGNEEPEPLILEFESRAISIRIGETHVLNPIVKSGEFQRGKCIWKSSNTQAVIVSDGTIMGNALGTSEISLSYDGVIMANCTVTVKPIDIETVSIEPHDAEVTIGGTLTLSATVTPQNATYKDLKWESSDESIVTVSKTGCVRAEGIGQATVTASDINGSAYDVCSVTVLPVPVSGISCQDYVKVLLGGETRLKANILPKDATNQSVIWESLNTDIATVDKDGFVKGVSKGMAKVVARSEDGGFQASCDVEVAMIDSFCKVFTREGCDLAQNHSRFYLTLWLETNVDSSVTITSILVTDSDGFLRYAKSPYVVSLRYYKQFEICTVIGGGGHLLNNPLYRGDGWHFTVKYIWRGTEYTVEHTHVHK